MLENVLAVKQVVYAAREMQTRIEAPPFQLDGHEVYVTISAGIAMHWPGDDTSELDLLRQADQAMRHAKRRGPGLVEVFTPTLPLRTSDLRLEADLHHALERNEFEVWYQPIISLNHDQMAGMEALVRWRHPERGMVSPGQFIPLAEETGYILPLGRWVLLRRLPVDQLKIDRTFVDGLGKIPENTAIVHVVITFARTLKMSVTGEGIETMEQLRELKLLGCDRGQGYLFSRPVTAGEIQHLIANL